MARDVLDLLTVALSLVLGGVAYAQGGFTAEVVLWAVITLWASGNVQARHLGEKIDAADRHRGTQMKLLLEKIEERTQR